MLSKRILLIILALTMTLLPGISAGSEQTYDAKSITTMSHPKILDILEDAKGKVVLINFFASWCEPCLIEVPTLMAIRQTTSEDKLLLIGISVDESMDDLLEYANKVKFNYPIHTADASIVRWARVSMIPHLIIFDKQGEVRRNAPGLVEEADLRALLQELMEK